MIFVTEYSCFISVVIALHRWGLVKHRIAEYQNKFAFSVTVSHSLHFTLQMLAIYVSVYYNANKLILIAYII